MILQFIIDVHVCMFWICQAYIISYMFHICDKYFFVRHPKTFIHFPLYVRGHTGKPNCLMKRGKHGR